MYQLNTDTADENGTCISNVFFTVIKKVLNLILFWRFKISFLNKICKS